MRQLLRLRSRGRYAQTGDGRDCLDAGASRVYLLSRLSNGQADAQGRAALRRARLSARSVPGRCSGLWRRRARPRHACRNRRTVQLDHSRRRTGPATAGHGNPAFLCLGHGDVRAGSTDGPRASGRPHGRRGAGGRLGSASQPSSPVLSSIQRRGSRRARHGHRRHAQDSVRGHRHRGPRGRFLPVELRAPVSLRRHAGVVGDALAVRGRRRDAARRLRTAQAPEGDRAAASQDVGPGAPVAYRHREASGCRRGRACVHPVGSLVQPAAASAVQVQDGRQLAARVQRHVSDVGAAGDHGGGDGGRQRDAGDPHRRLPGLLGRVRRVSGGNGLDEHGGDGGARRGPRLRERQADSRRGSGSS